MPSGRFERLGNIRVRAQVFLSFVHWQLYSGDDRQLFFWFVVTLAGFEPATSGLGNRCSIQLSYRATSCVFATVSSKPLGSIRLALSGKRPAELLRHVLCVRNGFQETAGLNLACPAGQVAS